MKSSIFDIGFFQEYLRDKKNVAESTVHTYSVAVERFIKEDPTLDKLNDYNAFIIKYAVKKRANYYYSALKAYIEFKIQDGNLRSRLLDGLVRPPERTTFVQERKFLSEERIIDVVNHMKEQKHRIIALIQTLTGVRAGDILRLPRGNIQIENYNNKSIALRIIIIGKRKKRNVVYIHDEVAKGVILDWVQNNFLHDDYYFISTVNRWGKKMDAPNFDHLYRYNYYQYWLDLKIALNNCGIDPKDFATHDIRRCFARRVWEKFKDVHVLQGMLNHSDPKVTLKYLEQSGLKNVDYHYEMQK